MTFVSPIQRVKSTAVHTILELIPTVIRARRTLPACYTRNMTGDQPQRCAVTAAVRARLQASYLPYQRSSNYRQTVVVTV